MRTPMILVALVVAAVSMAFPAGAAQVESGDRFFLRGEGCGATEDPYLSTRSGSDGLDGCGGIGGMPFNEVFEHAGINEATTFAARDGMPIVIDHTRNLTGTIVAEQWVGGTVSAGQVIVEADISGFQGSGSFMPVALGTYYGEAIVTPLDGDGVEFDFDLDIPASVSTAPFTSLSIDVKVRGASMNNSNLGLEGHSFFDVPTLVEETP